MTKKTNEIEIPEGVEAEVENNTLVVKGKEGENKREFKTHMVKIEKKGNKIILNTKRTTKREKKMTNTIRAHIINMIKGVQEKFVYKLKICFLHFPITVSIEKKEALIKNFLGEKVPRKIKLLEKADINVDKEIITVKSVDKEIAGQTAADFEKITRISLRDRRVFQDGIFITEKAGEAV
ncbi:MAG: 50S ribosomal protein L6 [Nanoarchaeota archaeon]|nr:50S ribosomal protein L6 [Nanoarchaeota archaeon]